MKFWAGREPGIWFITFTQSSFHPNADFVTSVAHTWQSSFLVASTSSLNGTAAYLMQSTSWLLEFQSTVFTWWRQPKSTSLFYYLILKMSYMCFYFFFLIFWSFPLAVTGSCLVLMITVEIVYVFTIKRDHNSYLKFCVALNNYDSSSLF